MTFITFLTPTFRRPKALAQCLASVQKQTAVDRIQQIVIVDHVGVGVGGMFTMLPHYAPIVQGQYVHILCDDDVLTDSDVVAEVERAARGCDCPPFIIVEAEKGGIVYPVGPAWPPQLGRIDLGCLIVRADVWSDHAHHYGNAYEGDYHFAAALKQSAVAPYLELSPLLFSRGAVSRGAPES